MKIGIVTVYRNINYGSKLQSFALQSVLKKIGANKAENLIVCNQDKNNKKNKTIVNQKYLKKLLSLLLNPSKLFERLINNKLYRRIIKFNKYLKENINESIFSTDDIQERIKLGIHDYDFFICGSDQIWAPNQFNEAYFLGFVDNKNIKISYATSIGLPNIPENLIYKYKTLISDISHVSLREKDGAELVKNLIGEDFPVVLDPTLLLTKTEWLNHSNDYFIEDKYILCLLLGENPDHRKWINEYSLKYNVKIVTLPMKQIDYKFGNKQLFDVDPKEFISLINKATIVFTDSYHGMLFSVNFNKDFYCFMRFEDDSLINQNSRIINFLSDLNLNNRIIRCGINYSENISISNIDWDNINRIINNKREFSIQYLKNALNV